MPSFRRFLRPVPVPVPVPVPSSSPECDQPRVTHLPTDRSTERPVTIPDTGKVPRGAPGNPFEGAPISLTFRNTPVTDRTANERYKSVVASDPTPAKQTLIRRVTSKLHISIPLRSATDALRSRPSTRTLSADVNRPTQRPRPPRAQKPASSTLPNSFVSKEHREAALRERGLLPPCKDFSQQEREIDERLGYMPSPTSTTFGGSTEAERFKANWLAMNGTSESSESDCAPPATPHETETGPLPSLSPDAVSRKSGESRTDVSCVGRPSCCSSLPPLSTSYLEVLHEDPSEHGPITPPALSPVNPPIIVASPVGYPMILESPVSYSFSSKIPGSTLESQSRSDHPPPVPRKDVLPASRRRTVDSDERPRKVVGSTLSRLGTRSLTNLRRSVTDSLKRQSMSTLSSADHPSCVVQAPRTAISPTIHSMASILRETRDIADAESRRLSELAFLD